MKKFEIPELEIDRFVLPDILTASPIGEGRVDLGSGEVTVPGTGEAGIDEGYGPPVWNTDNGLQ